MDRNASTRLAQEPQAVVQVLPLAANQVGPASPPAGSELKVVPSATASAGGGHDRASPGRNAGRAEVHATRVD